MCRCSGLKREEKVVVGRWGCDIYEGLVWRCYVFNFGLSVQNILESGEYDNGGGKYDLRLLIVVCFVLCLKFH